MREAILPISTFNGRGGHPVGSPGISATCSPQVIRRERIEKVLETLDGALAIVTLDCDQPLRSMAGIGDVLVTSPQATDEAFHLFEDDLSVFVIIRGRACLECKPPGVSQPLLQLGEAAGDILVAPAGMLHRLRWGSNQGLAYVFRLPMPQPPSQNTSADAYSGSQAELLPKARA